VIDFFKSVMRPSSMTCLMALLTPGVVLLFVPPLAKWARRWLALVVLIYWILSTTVSTNLLARTLTHGFEPIASGDPVRGLQAVILLGGGAIDVRASGGELMIVGFGTALRTLEAARIYHLAGSPLVIASGGVTNRNGQGAPESDAMRRALEELAVPADRIVAESQSKTTRDEAVIVAGMLRARGLTRVALVTSPMHMRRALAAFGVEGVRPIPAVSEVPSEFADSPRRFVPSDIGLWLGEAIVYEWAARAYYQWKGWI
jgi:uncharacterized SAM-binding protein YcdF (DUF218 family)